MQTTQSDNAATMMRRALELEPDLDPDLSESSRFERCADRPLALALDVIRNHGCEDDHGWGLNDTIWDRVDRWLVADTDDGFVVVEECTDADDAQRVLESLVA